MISQTNLTYDYWALGLGQDTAPGEKGEKWVAESSSVSSLELQ